jgi:hypothetical protein
MAQEQVLKHEVVARTYRDQDGREKQPEQFEHSFSIADLPSRGVLPSYTWSSAPAATQRPSVQAGWARLQTASLAIGEREAAELMASVPE